MSINRPIPFLICAAALLAVTLMTAPPASAIEPQGTPLPGSSIPQFVDPLPGLHAIVAGAGQIELDMTEFRSNVMPSTFVPAFGSYSGTWVWSYHENGQAVTANTSYIGPVIVATRGTPTEIKYVNNLGSGKTTNVLAWSNSTDQTLHWGDPLGDMGSFANYTGPVPAVPHLHGGEVPPVIDGGPNAWFTSDGNYLGSAYYTKGFVGDVAALPALPDASYPAGSIVKLEGGGFYVVDGTGNNWEPYHSNSAVYRYPNSQEAGPLWFHDHLLGMTRLNVYAGLAGAYLLTDPPNDPTDLPPLVPLVIQDRMFDTNGQLYFPNLGINPEHPFWTPEFEGDTIVVNGKVWPYLSVEPKRYRFLIINGSNARAYELFLLDPLTDVMGPSIYQIGTDGGYLDYPVPIDPNAPNGQLKKLVLLPGERADIIVDFAGMAGQTLILRNIGRHPYPKGVPPSGSTIGRIIQIRVDLPLAGEDNSYDPSTGDALRAPLVKLVEPITGSLGDGVVPDKTRQLTLNEVMAAGGPLEVLVNNTKWAGTARPGFSDFSSVTIGGLTEYYSELPNEGETEVWEIVNLTADAHPIHTHLTQFQLMNRQGFNVNKYNKLYESSFPGGEFVPAFGPPLDYNTGNTRALGGNPDITSYLQGAVIPPDANERGWKDTVRVLPGQVARFIVRYTPTDTEVVGDPAPYYPFDPQALGRAFVWHCHIIDHEDNEMMRPLQVQPLAVGRSITDY